MSSGPDADGTYRRDIDGLRAIAVLAVIGYHAGLAGFSGGYVGVDIFFVISGFLITQLLLRDLRRGAFSLTAFFQRRFRRLLPVLTVVVLSCLVPAAAWMLPEQLTALSESAVAALLMVPNIYFWRRIDYFNPGFDSSPLLHTWSLGVEEQFYLVFPFVILWCGRRAVSRTGLVLAIGAVLSFMACEAVMRTSSGAAFYFLPFRAWELLLGGMAACWKPDLRTWLNDRTGACAWLFGLLPLLCLASISLAIARFDDQTPVPGVWTLWPLLGTIGLLLTRGINEPITRLLEWRPLVGIGLISYSAYLWHFPVFAFAELARLQAPPPGLKLVLIVSTLMLSAASWRFIEQPARRRTLSFRLVLGAVGLGFGVIVSFAWLVHQSHGLPGRLPPAAIELLSSAERRNPRQVECLSSVSRFLTPRQACRFGAEHQRATVALLGDSHADALFEAMDSTLRRVGLAGRFMAFAGCPPVPGVYRVGIRHAELCNDYFSAAYAQLAADTAIDTVIVAARWGTYLEPLPFDNGEGGHEAGKPLTVDVLDSAGPTSDDEARIARISTAYRLGIQRLLQTGKRVVLVYPIPEVGWHVPRWLALHIMRGRPLAADLTTSAALFERRNQRAIQALDSIEGDPRRLIKVHPSDALCHASIAERCAAQMHGKPLYYDDNHLNLDGARLVATQIEDALAWQ